MFKWKNIDDFQSLTPDNIVNDELRDEITNQAKYYISAIYLLAHREILNDFINNIRKCINNTTSREIVIESLLYCTPYIKQCFL